LRLAYSTILGPGALIEHIDKVSGLAAQTWRRYVDNAAGRVLLQDWATEHKTCKHRTSVLALPLAYRIAVMVATAAGPRYDCGRATQQPPESGPGFRLAYCDKSRGLHASGAPPVPSMQVSPQAAG
jgi:hypothetical protein